MASGLPAGSKATGQHIFFVGSAFNSGTTPRELQEFESYSENTGAAPVDTETLPSGRSQTTTGARPINTISIQLRFMPHLPDHQELVKRPEDSKVKSLKFTQEQREISAPASGATVSIATTGAVTFGGTAAAHSGGGAVGDAIRADDKDHVIIAIRPKSGATEVNASKLADNIVFVRGGLAAAVTDEAYTVVSPAMSVTIPGTVTQAPGLGDIPNDVAGFRTGTIIFTPSSDIPAMTLDDAPSYS